MKAVLIPGDGIGREIAESVREVSAALNTGIEWQEFAAGAEYAAESGELIAPGTLDAIEACGWALKGPTATPIGKGFRSINVQLRQRFSTYANLRPALRMSTSSTGTLAASQLPMRSRTRWTAGTPRVPRSSLPAAVPSARAATLLRRPTAAR